MVILPVPAFTSSLKVSVMVVPASTSVALFAGTLETSVGAVVSAGAAVVKERVVSSEIPAKALPASSVTAPASTLT